VAKSLTEDDHLVLIESGGKTPKNSRCSEASQWSPRERTAPRDHCPKRSYPSVGGVAIFWLPRPPNRERVPFLAMKPLCTLPHIWVYTLAMPEQFDENYVRQDSKNDSGKSSAGHFGGTSPDGCPS